MKLPRNKEVLELKVPLFTNKRNGQISITLPKKKYQRFMKDCPPSERVKISLWRPPK